MLIQRGWILLICWGVIACEAPARKRLAAEIRATALQKRQINNTEIAVTYMPACWLQATDHDTLAMAGTSTITFRLDIHTLNSHLRGMAAGEAFSYGIDTLFLLVQGADTIAPLYAHRVANGNLTGMEYLVGFDRHRFNHSPDLHLIFKDWLFSAARVHFTWRREWVQKIDSLSCSI
jgi:hypothetical protein